MTAGHHSAWISARGDEGARGDPGLIFPYWSFTKTALAICALRLAGAGRLDLDVPLEGEAFSLRQLLSHTAGVPDYCGLDAYRDAVAADEEAWPRDRLIATARAQGALFAPGQGWAYANTGYLLARMAVETAADRGLGDLIGETICRPLGLESVALAEARADFARVCWPGAARYHPGWVYHGCLTGTARDAARLLHGLFCTDLLLPPELRAQMLARVPLGGAIPGRPWTDCGYDLGLMDGWMGAAGRAVGHSGGGPFSANAVYHFPDRDDPLTVASFTAGPSEAPAEWDVAQIAAAAG